MRAAAILAPNATANDLRRFRISGVEIAVVSELTAGEDYDALLVLGGDGSVHRQLSTAVATQVPVLCVPTGSGNDFARALGLARVADSLLAWRKFCSSAGNVRMVDLGEITCAPAAGSPQSSTTTKTLYCCVAGVGLDSEVNRRANRLPSWLRGHGGYVLSLPGALLGFEAPQITLELIDGDGQRRIEERAMLVAFANAHSYGHGMRIAPRARLDDGKLDVCFVRRTSRLRLLRLFPTVFSGGHLSLPEIEYAQCSAVNLRSGRPLDIFGDGEYIGRTPAVFRVRPHAMPVIAPEQTGFRSK